ncbi:MAG: hypothetical protein R3253_08325 [Longimicrobiales bacterium]|nr:hypothetical protein [Longimicrobiales bacterium]
MEVSVAGPVRRAGALLLLVFSVATTGCGGEGGREGASPPQATASPPTQAAEPPPSQPADEPPAPESPPSQPADEPPARDSQPPPAVPSSWAYTCSEGLRFIVHFREDEAQIDLPSRSLRLPSARRGQAPAYTDGAGSLSVVGSSATLQVGNEHHGGCAGEKADSPEDAARRLGFDFRGIGQEPGWLVDVDLDREIRWVGSYGEVRFATGRPETREDGGAVVWQARTSDHAIRVRVRPEPCNDSMSGRPYPLTVRVTVDGSDFSGCGLWLASDG